MHIQRPIKSGSQQFFAGLICLALTACGGSGGSDESRGGGGTTTPPTAAPQTKAESSRFLKQASFGATGLDAEHLLEDGYVRWINSEFEQPVSLMLESLDQTQRMEPAANPKVDWIYEAFWKHAALGQDQLRQRVTFALSQILVVSLKDPNIARYPRGVADYYDTLARNAFGNYRDLLRDVSLHPIMGVYLSHLRNEKGDPASGRVPDENYAREVMQLFSIGLYELNIDGTARIDSSGNPVETYETGDVEGLAKVFTGLSWAGPDTTKNRFRGSSKAENREVLPMQSYPQYHSVEKKRFLGTVIPAGSANAITDVELAVDALFNHPNAGPFIARQMIQRLVTSNPSAAYVGRVAKQFNDNGEGTRGDMRALVKAILFDVEARDMGATANPSTGKIREPILRFAHWMRAFRAYSGTGRFKVGNTDDASSRLGQTVMRSPSVFNFYRPGYVPPNTPLADAAMVSPEMQITHETSVAGWLNMMRTAVASGWGSSRDVKGNYELELSRAHDPAELVEQVNGVLLNGSMSNALRARITETVESRMISTSNETAAEKARLQRVQLAVFMTLASPEFAVLK